MVKGILRALIFLCIIALILSASFFRDQHADSEGISRIRDLNSVSRVVYYRVEAQAGPRFRLAGAETGVRLVSHLALDRGVAWPISRYRPQTRYSYGLELVYRDPKGQKLWTKQVHISSAVSKGEPRNGAWTQEAAFVENRTFVPTDPRITQIELPDQVPVDASLEVRLLGADARFAMVRAYGLRERSTYARWFDSYALSPQDKRDMVGGITYLQWDEIQKDEQDRRLALDVSRLTASSSLSSESKIEALYLSPFRVKRVLKPKPAEHLLSAPWRETYVVSGPAKLRFNLHFSPEQRLRSNRQEQHLQITSIGPSQDIHTTRHAFSLSQDRQGGAPSFPVELGPGEHTLKFLWEPPNPTINPPLIQGVGQSGLSFRGQRRNEGVRFSLTHDRPRGLDVSRDDWNNSEALLREIPPARWRSKLYYVDQTTPPLHFLVPGDANSARLFKLEHRTWDASPGTPAATALHYAFTDTHNHELYASRVDTHSDFDLDSWVEQKGLAPGQQEEEAYKIGVGQRQAASGLAPKGSTWLKVTANAPALVRVSARVPASQYTRRPTDSAGPRQWIPLLAKEHDRWALLGQYLPLHTTHRQVDIVPSQEGEDLEPKWWRGVHAQEGARQHRVLEETLYRDHASGLVSASTSYPSHEDLWEDCPGCWIEIPAFSSYRIIDRYEQKRDPQLLWITQRGESQASWQSGRCTLSIDGNKDEMPCPAHRKKETRSELSGASHAFSWTSGKESTRLFVDRWSLPQNGAFLDDLIPIYRQRKLEALGPKGLSYAFSTQADSSQVLHFRVYRKVPRFPTKAMHSPAAAFSLVLDDGTPRRVSGPLFSHFTNASRRKLVMPAQETELIFLDGLQSGPYLRFDLQLPVGPDIQAGQHLARLRPLDPGEYWVRVFERDHDTESTLSRISSGP